MRMRQNALALIIVASLLFSKSFGDAGFTDAIAIGAGPRTPGAATLLYDFQTGNYTVNGGGERISTWEHRDMPGLFDCPQLPVVVLPGLFDVCSSNKLFKLDPEGFEEVDFGNILPPGLTFDDINGVGTIRGSFLPEGGLDRNVATSPHLYIANIPEPSSMTLMGLGMLGILGMRRRRL